MTTDLRLGDCLDVMRTLADASMDAVVTDPPAGIAFMGKEWDSQRTRARFVDFLSPRLAEARRVAKPGAYMLCWALPRTSHWTGLAIEDAGWVIRDRVSHLFGTGFPKSKACLKPACEDWWLAWNPAKNVTPLNIDDCRISAPDGVPRFTHRQEPSVNAYGDGKNGSNRTGETSTLGRWPANVIHDGSPEVLEAFAEFGELRTGGRHKDGLGQDARRNCFGKGWSRTQSETAGDTGTAARFFYCAKASKSDRGDGNTHPTVKNTALMAWLIRLITPPGGVVLDPFAGSGSTGVAALSEVFGFVGIEQNAEYLETARRRIAAASKQAPLFGSLAV